MGDKYDRAIIYLRKHPEEISNVWGEAGCLFAFCTPSGTDKEDSRAGCLTMIHSDAFCADKKSFRNAVIGRSGRRRYAIERQIKADADIPDAGALIEISDLPLFAKWQRKLDRLIR